jgi:hypothetical protein
MLVATLNPVVYFITMFTLAAALGRWLRRRATAGQPLHIRAVIPLVAGFVSVGSTLATTYVKIVEVVAQKK